MLAGLTAACGGNRVTVHAGADVGADGGAAAEAMPGNMPVLEMPVREASAEPPAAAAEAAAASTALPTAATSTVKWLPLRRGFYVTADTPCNQASNATLQLVTREGINAARTVCRFRTIEKTGATSYRVT